MLTGSIAGLGHQYVIGLKAMTCDTGDILAEAQEQAAGKEAVLKALDAVEDMDTRLEVRLARKQRARLESHPLLAKRNWRRRLTSTSALFV